jgi:hypothetical protein
VNAAAVAAADGRKTRLAARCMFSFDLIANVHKITTPSQKFTQLNYSFRSIFTSVALHTAGRNVLPPPPPLTNFPSSDKITNIMEKSVADVKLMMMKNKKV